MKRSVMKTGTIENGFKKRGLLKTLRFQCGQVYTKTFKNGDKKSSYTVAFIRVLIWTLGENASKSIRFEMKAHYCGEVRRKRKPGLVWAKMLCSVLVETEINTFSVKCISVAGVFIMTQNDFNI